jgi:beta-mannanase
MTNLEAMQDERLRELIHDVELLGKLVKFANSEEYKTLCDEIAELHKQVKIRWRELMEEG